MLDTRFDYVALGHVHLRGNPGTNAWYSGSTERTSWGDQAAQPGYALITLGDRGDMPLVDFVDIVARPMETLSPIDGGERTARDLADMILARAGALGMPHAMVRVELQNTPRPLFRETEAIVRREIGGSAWHIRLTAPGDLLDPLGRDAISGLAELHPLKLFDDFLRQQTDAGIYDAGFAEPFPGARACGPGGGDAEDARGRQQRRRVMILAAVEIENYKQYAGSHCIDFPEQGMVAITGPNGAGKTTLFEAIEWCLYGPRTIPHASIPPHDGVGATRVRVTLQDPHDGRRYVVKRTLRNGISAAEAYRGGRSRSAAGTGPARRFGLRCQTARGVAASRVRLDVLYPPEGADLFRRPDADRSPGRGGTSARFSDRTRRAGRDWNRAHPGATGNSLVECPVRGRLRGSRFRGRDRLRRGDATQGAGTRDVAAQALSSADEAAERTRTSLDAWRDLQERDNALGTRLADVAGQTATAASRRDAATAELGRLDQRQAERAVLLPEAETAAPLAFEVTLLDEQRERAERLRSLQGAVQAATDRLDAISRRTVRLVSDAQATAWGLTTGPGGATTMRVQRAESGACERGGKSRRARCTRSSRCDANRAYDCPHRGGKAGDVRTVSQAPARFVIDQAGARGPW